MHKSKFLSPSDIPGSFLLEKGDGEVRRQQVVHGELRAHLAHREREVLKPSRSTSELGSRPHLRIHESRSVDLSAPFSDRLKCAFFDLKGALKSI
jgi:hypothetical protein